MPGDKVSGHYQLKVVKDPDASEGAMLGVYAGPESHPIPTTIPHAGQFRVWVRHYHTHGKYSNFFVLIRDDLGEVAAYQTVDFKAKLQAALPEKTETATTNAVKSSLVWSSFPMNFERPFQGTLSFGQAYGIGDAPKFGIDCVIMTDDPSFDPQKADWAKLPAAAGPIQALKSPGGMKPAPVFTAHSAFFAGNTNADEKLELAVLIAQSTHRDYAWLVQMGANFNHGWNGGSVEYGIEMEATPGNGPDYYPTLQAFAKTVPANEGRFVNGKGVTNDFSYFYEPFRKAYADALTKSLTNSMKQIPMTRSYMVIGESGGSFDYGGPAQIAFHKWLTQRFGTIAKLNELWRTNYASFDDVVLPQPPKETDNKAAWFAFREFNGLALAERVALTARIIRENDPTRYSISQSSCLHINSPEFTSTGSIDYEDLINVGFANEKHFGMDAYSTSDTFCGADMDFLLSLADGRRIMNSEFNVHSHDPREMARTCWSQIGKGVKGIMTWCLQSTPSLWMYDMWGMLDVDNTARPRLGALTDTFQEVHHLERILGPAKGIPFTKPVALYFSRMDLSLSQPTFGIYSDSFDSPYRIYGVLRGLGYQVRWITPKQINAGELKNVGAVVMVGAKYMPGETATKLAKWVEDGGALIGDQWPGALNEYDRPQETLFKVFGIRPEEAAKPVDKAKAQQAFESAPTPVAGGIDPDVLRAVTSDELLKRVEELWSQWDSTNAVAKAAGHWHLSGFDLKKIKPTTAEILGMGMGDSAGIPAMTINRYGKGNALYSSLMLGTLYESGPIRAEWDSQFEGPGLYHILDAFLRNSGVEPFAQAGLPERMAWKTRIEIPQIDPKGNVFIGVTSRNDGPLASLPLTLLWPASAPKPKLVLACTGGSRQMQQVPFEIKAGKLSVTMPGFDTHASLLALTDTDPLISLEITGASRGVAGLLDVTPNARLKIKATIWNPSPCKLAAGEVKLFAAPGWFCKSGEEKVSSIAPYGSREVEFEVAAPAICSKRTLKPIVVKYESGKVTSTPATEMVWWTNSK